MLALTSDGRRPLWDKGAQTAPNEMARVKMGGSMMHEKPFSLLDRDVEGTLAPTRRQAHRHFGRTLREWDGRVDDAALTAATRARHPFLMAGSGLSDEGRIERHPAAYGERGVEARFNTARADAVFSSTLRADDRSRALGPSTSRAVTVGRGVSSRLERHRPQGKLNKLSSERARRERIAARTDAAGSADERPGWLTERARRNGREGRPPAWGAAAYPGRDGWLRMTRPKPATEVRV
eukprot:1349884-Prymnesium_polylepis.1